MSAALTDGPRPPPPGTAMPRFPDTEIGVAAKKIYLRLLHGGKPIFGDHMVQADVDALACYHKVLRARNWGWGIWHLIRARGVDHVLAIFRETAFSGELKFETPIDAFAPEPEGPGPNEDPTIFAA